MTDDGNTPFLFLMLKELHFVFHPKIIIKLILKITVGKHYRINVNINRAF